MAASFPLAAPQSLQNVILSYLYQQYNDDDDLLSFVDAFNTMAQQYVDWFNRIGLPVYTGPLIAGQLLDWVAAGLYGLLRPTLVTGGGDILGPFDTLVFNDIVFDDLILTSQQPVGYTSDDIFKRIITWHFFKGDGKVFNTRWLKRRIMRFLFGVNGINFNVDQTYPVSISFGVGNQVNIVLGPGISVTTGGAIFDGFTLNGAAFNAIDATYTPGAPVPNALTFKEAADCGVLELPFQFEYIVHVATV